MIPRQAVPVSSPCRSSRRSKNADLKGGLDGRTRVALGALLLLLALTATTASAHAAGTLYVAKNNTKCSNTGPGSATQPFCSISAAASKVTAGGTVQVSSGTYAERVTLVSSGTAASPIKFFAVPGETVTVTGGSGTNALGFHSNGKSYVTIEGFTVSGTSQDGIVVSSGSTHIILRGNNVMNAGQQVSGLTARGIRVDGSNDNQIVGNSVHDNSDYGIYVVRGSTGNLVTGNTTFRNTRGWERAASGIRVHSSAGNTISNNISHHNEDSGIELVSGSQHNLVVNNVIYDNGDHGIDDTGNSPNNSIIGNTVYRSVTAGIDLEGVATGTLVQNNIAVDNGINSPRTSGNIRVDTDSFSGGQLDYNLVWLTRPGRNYTWGAGYDTLAQMQMASGQEMHSTQADPLVVSPCQPTCAVDEVPDFRLKPGSPAIDAGNAGALSAGAGAPGASLATDADGNPRRDDPATPDTGAGSPTYYDRGAFEFQPRDLPPSAALAVSPDSGTIDLLVTAVSSGSVDPHGLSPIGTYSFDWGDGSPATGEQSAPTATHTYRAAGTYTVTVTVKDTAGLKSTPPATHVVTVRDDPPKAAVSASPASGPGPLQVTADASGSSDGDATPIVSYLFEWGDGSPATAMQSEPTATHTYQDPGEYTLTVTVTDKAGQTSKATTVVRVFGADLPPTPALSVSPTSGTVDLKVTADATGSFDSDDGIASYSFDWGDGWQPTGPQSTLTASHTYRKGGSWTVTLKVTDVGGNASTATQVVTVDDPAPDAALTVSPGSGLAPLDVTADASASTDRDGTPIESYSFDWGDGSPPTGRQSAATATHTYAARDLAYRVTVTVRDTAGQESTATTDIVASGNVVGNPGFESDLTGWNTSGSAAGVTAARVTAPVHTGSGAAQLVNGGTTAGAGSLNAFPDWVRKSVAGRYRFSIWVRGETAGATIKARVTEFNGAANAGSAASTATLTTAWQRLSVEYTPTVPGSTLDFNAFVTNAQPGICFYADDAAI